MRRADAILLVGPTGSGKTPLGDLLAAEGLWDRPCVHFDFGRQLRQAAAAPPGGVLSPDQLAVVRELLSSGELLADGQFAIAERLLRDFLTGNADPSGVLVVLNGLPRHVGQAHRIEEMHDLPAVRAVVELACERRVVLERIRMNAGGDRTGRDDDGEAAVLARFETYRRRTRPLVDFYRRRGRAVLTAAVGPTTRPEDLREFLLARRPPGLA
ncbi:MAG: nucleoside monophosphate kinase [Planctomycetes bacterium]|nr:nucleoside monophosphate kinase [Planctomycetota bacterium]